MRRVDQPVPRGPISERDQLELVLEAAGMALWTWDVRDGSIRWMGDGQTVLGYSIESWEGTAEELGRLPLPADRERMTEAVRAALEDGAPYELQFRAKRPDGSIGWLETIGKVVRDECGVPLLMMGSLRDITERKRDEELRERFMESVVAAEDAERRRIARELHDGTGQALTSLLVELHQLETELPSVDLARARLKSLRERTARVLEEIGHISRGLHPSVLDDLGFVPAVERFVEEFGTRHGVHADLHINGLDGETRLPVAVETSLYRILQEALTNVAKHAAAGATSVIVERGAGFMRLIVEDDGRGFHHERHGTITIVDGVGLHSIRERVALLGGTVTLESTPGVGTTLYVRVPLDD